MTISVVHMSVLSHHSLRSTLCDICTNFVFGYFYSKKDSLFNCSVWTLSMRKRDHIPKSKAARQGLTICIGPNIKQAFFVS